MARICIGGIQYEVESREWLLDKIEAVDQVEVFDPRPRLGVREEAAFIVKMKSGDWYMELVSSRTQVLDWVRAHLDPRRVKVQWFGKEIKDLETSSPLAK
jgi:hypothetical protein